LLLSGLFAAYVADYREAVKTIGLGMAEKSIGKDVVTFSLALIQKVMNSQMLQVAFFCAFIWLLGLGVIWFGTRKIVCIMALLRNERNSLFESKDRFHALFSRACDGIFIMTTDGKLVEVNDSLARMHGYSPQEMLPMGLKDLDTPETSHLAPERIRRLLAGENLIFEVEHYHKDGHIFSLEVSASLITSDGISYIQCFHRDISERKQLEEEREEALSRLQKIASLAHQGLSSNIVYTPMAVPVFLSPVKPVVRYTVSARRKSKRMRPKYLPLLTRTTTQASSPPSKNRHET
jgi:PAS domain S-box-containing protein